MSAARYAWMDRALCAQADPDAWTETGPGHGSRKPKQICAHCPVRPQCDAHEDRLRLYDGAAMSGVWAGRSKRQRENQRRQIGEAA